MGQRGGGAQREDLVKVSQPDAVHQGGLNMGELSALGVKNTNALHNFYIKYQVFRKYFSNNW